MIDFTLVTDAFAAVRPHAGSFATWAWRVLNTNFSAALFGALGGSYSAYLLGVRNDRRNKLREEMAATNNAIGMTNNIINIMLSLKGQHTGPIAERYKQQFADYFAHVIAPNPAPGMRPVELVLQADFRMIAPPHTMIDALQRTIVERVTRAAAAQMVIGSLQRSVEALVQALNGRTQLSLAMRQVPQEIQLLLYFGLPDAHGNIDDTFPDTMTAMTAYVNDCLYFSELLMEILAKHGVVLREAYGRRAPKMLKLDLSDPRVVALMPDRSEFPDFELQFRGPEKPGFLARVWAWLSRRFGAET